MIESFSAFTDRKIGVSYNCSSHKVLGGGNGKSSRINIENIGDVFLSQPVPDSTTFITKLNHTCNNNDRCSIVEAFESSSSDPWYYVCEISLNQTRNDPKRISEISDRMARIATASIAQVGYRHPNGLSAQIYSRETMWGKAALGKHEDVGMMIGIYAIASIAGAVQFNPFTSHYGLSPAEGFQLKLNHQKTFYLIIFLTNFFHLALVVTASIVSTRIKIGPSGYLGMSLLLKPVSDRLLRIHDKLNENAYKEMSLNTYVRYEKDLSSKNDWHLNISHA